MFVLFSYGQPLYFHHLTVDNGLPHNTIGSFVEDKYGFIWIASLEGVSRFDGYKVVTYYADNTEKSIITNRPVAMIRDNNDDIWISFSSTNEVCRYNYNSDDFSRYSIEQLDEPLQIALNRVIGNKKFYHSSRNNITWTITENQLVQTNINTREKIVYSGDIAKKSGMSNTFVMSIYLDKNDILWVGTDNDGVYYVDTNKKGFQHYSYELENSIRAICEDENGQLWVGTRNNGVIRVNQERNSYKQFDYILDSLGKQVKKIYEDVRGDIWIGTKSGLYYYNCKTTKINHFTMDTKPSIPDNWVYAINEDNNGLLWIGAWNGIASYDANTDNIITYKTDNIENFNSIRSIARGKDGGIWVATEKGLFFLEYNVENNIAVDIKHTHYKNPGNNGNSINNDFLYSIDVDEDGNVWIGTVRGLCMYDIHEQKFTNFHDVEFLNEEGIRGVLCNQDDVWISYGKGLTRLNRKTFAARHYDKLDGLLNNEFSEDAYYKNNRTGELFFGGNNGLNAFFPDNIKDNINPPNIVFTGLRVQNKPVKINQEINGDIILKSPIIVCKNLEFNHKNKEFEIEFSALHYSNPSKNRYAYMLEGFDDSWIYANSSRRSAIYSGLPSGNYTLKVKASNCDGIWSENPIEMGITILPPWWASRIAYTVYSLLFLFVCYLIVRNIIARKNLKHKIQLEQVKAEKAEEISNIRSNFFTGISHELRTPITLIIDPLRKLINEKSGEDETRKTYDLMYRNATRLLSLINQLLDFRRIELSKPTLQPARHDIVAFVKNGLAMFEFTAKKRKILLSLEAEKESHILIFDDKVLDKILVNLISNALKYSPDNTQITLRLMNERDVESYIAENQIDVIYPEMKNSSWYAVQITDQGVGIAPDEKEKIFDLFYRVDNNDSLGSGIGLALTKELVDIHKGYITVDSKQGEGSCFTVFLPIMLQPYIEENSNELHIEFDDEIISSEFDNGSEHLSEHKVDRPELPILLIVEDNEDIRDYTKQTLSDDYEVITSRDGSEAWDKALEVIPDLVVSDIMMPKISGIELCKKLKTDERTSHIPVVLLTAKQSDEARMEGFETGADDYIIKPFNSSVLKVRINNLIESRKKLRSLFGSATRMELKKISVNTADEKFINRAVNIVNSYISDSDFSVDIFAREMAVSRAQLFRKIKAMTNQTVQEFIMTIRMNKAADLLLTTEYPIGEITFMCGFSDASNFRRSFVRKFGVTPSNYIKSNLQ
jgi:signal transduction histidine kinase/ligand-binding sensor domain-containing protein/DNA-binding response OmpR family regulator